MNTVTQTLKFRETLESEAAEYGVVLSTEAIAGLSRYFDLLNVWNTRVHRRERR